MIILVVFQTSYSKESIFYTYGLSKYSTCRQCLDRSLKKILMYYILYLDQLV